jgi:hypothetical protein
LCLFLLLYLFSSTGNFTAKGGRQSDRYLPPPYSAPLHSTPLHSTLLYSILLQSIKK